LQTLLLVFAYFMKVN